MVRLQEERGRFIDLAGWKRRQHYELFRPGAHPFFSVTVEVDVTSLWRSCRSGRDSFLLAALYLMLRAVNASEAMRLRLRADAVWLHDRVSIGTTILRPDETFGLARFDPEESYDVFRRRGAETIEQVKQSSSLDASTGEDDLVYHSTLPWLRFTSFPSARAGDDSIPRITFGRCSTDGAVTRMPLAVEVHHALVDGLDVARLVESFQHDLDGFQQFLG